MDKYKNKRTFIREAENLKRKIAEEKSIVEINQGIIIKIYCI